MSFIDEWRLMIKENLCDECRDEIEKSDEEIKKKRDKLREKWNDPKYKTLPRDELWEESGEINKLVYEKGKSICFVFRADCGGDGMSLCKKHLMEIIKKIEDYE